MNESLTLDERYFEWVCGLVADPRHREPSKTFYLLMEILYKNPFIWFVPNDHNRAEDGRKLRDEFFKASGLRPDHDWFQLDCSMLEMLVGLAYRLEYKTKEGVVFWFWHILKNLGVHRLHDERMNDGYVRSVERVITQLNDRTYEPSGRGGIFPLKRPEEDQRELEIWYQMSEYLMENEDLLW